MAHTRRIRWSGLLTLLALFLGLIAGLAQAQPG